MDEPASEHSFVTRGVLVKADRGIERGAALALDSGGRVIMKARHWNGDVPIQTKTVLVSTIDYPRIEAQANGSVRGPQSAMGRVLSLCSGPISF